MSEKTKRFYLLYLFAAPVAALVAIAMRTAALLSVFDADLGFYSAPALAIANAGLLVLVGAVLALLTHELRELFVFSVDYRDMPSLFSGVFLAVALVPFAITLVLGAGGEAAPALGAALLAALSALGGAPLFVAHGFSGAARSTAKGMLALPLAFLGVLFPLYLNFEASHMLAIPPKLIAIAAWLFAAFFFLGEARIALDRARWAMHTYFTAMTALLSATVALPNLVYYAVRGSSLLGNTAHDFVMLGIMLFSTARLLAAFLSALRQGRAATQYATAFSAATAELSSKESPNAEASDR